MVIGAFVVLLGAAGRLAAQVGIGPTSPGSPDQATVVSVIDGDTVELDLGGKRERVRLLGVDAPESVAPTVPVQCHGPEASAALLEVLPPGTPVEVRRDVEARDHFGRLLLHLYRSHDGLFVNHWLVADGHAAAVSYAPNNAYRADFRAAERAARSNGLGLWGTCDGPDQPLDPTD